mmetsp:Transcript_72/g.176  ORF Transcript_72/g.176 Transcript_72/m.176 type:complete len:493 (-) Transcript_72:401-1879(-)
MYSMCFSRSAGSADETQSTMKSSSKSLSQSRQTVMPSFRKLGDAQDGQVGDAQIRQGLVLACSRLLRSLWMRGSAMGLSLFTGAGLEYSGSTMRFCMMTFGSADDPSSLTLFSPNMVVVTELFKMSWIPIIVGADVDFVSADVGGALESAFRLESSPSAALDVFVAEGGGDFIWGDGCGKVCTDPHNLLNLGKLWDDCGAEPLFREGEGVADAVVFDPADACVGLFRVLVAGTVAEGFESVVAETIGLVSVPLAMVASAVFLVTLSLDTGEEEEEEPAALGAATAVAAFGLVAAGFPVAVEECRKEELIISAMAFDDGTDAVGLKSLWIRGNCSLNWASSVVGESVVDESVVVPKKFVTWWSKSWAATLAESISRRILGKFFFVVAAAPGFWVEDPVIDVVDSVVAVHEGVDVGLKNLCSLGMLSWTWWSMSAVVSWTDSTKRCSFGKCDCVSPLLASRQAVHMLWSTRSQGIPISWHWMSRLRRLIFSRAS